MENSKKDQKKNKTTNKAYLQQTSVDKRPSLIINDGFSEDEEDKALSNVEDLENMFSGSQSESSILKELFSQKNFKTKTHLSGDEISIISRLYLMGRITKRPLIKDILDEFLVLRISKDRLSRKEFVDAHKNREENKGGMFGNLFGGQNKL